MEKYNLNKKIIEVFDAILEGPYCDRFEKITGVDKEKLSSLINNLNNFEFLPDDKKVEIISTLHFLFINACMIIDPVKIELTTTLDWDEVLHIYKELSSYHRIEKSWSK